MRLARIWWRRGVAVHSYAKPDPTTRAAWETEELFKQHFSNLVRFLRTGLRYTNDTEDIAQEALFRYFQARCAGEEIENPKGWIYRVGRHLLLDNLKRSKPILLDEDRWEEVEARHSSSADWSGPERSLIVGELPWDKLTKNERQCLLLRTQGFTYREVAETMEVAIPTVASYVSRAVKKLRKPKVRKRETPDSRRTAPLR